MPTPAGGKREEGDDVQCFFAQQQTIHVWKSQPSDTVSDTGVSAPRWHLTGTEPPLKGLEFSLVMGQEEERRKHQHADTSPEKEKGWSWASIDVWGWGNTDSKQKLWSKAESSYLASIITKPDNCSSGKKKKKKRSEHYTFQRKQNLLAYGAFCWDSTWMHAPKCQPCGGRAGQDICCVWLPNAMGRTIGSPRSNCLFWFLLGTLLGKL